MRRVVVCLGVFLAPLVSCHRVQLPIATSLGDLVRIERVDLISTDEGKVSPVAGEILYVLSFEGKKELPTPGVLPLVDSAGEERRPVYAGSPAKDGTLSRQQWKFDGALTAQDGKWAFAGQVKLPEPRVALVYSVPTGSAWFLKDGERRHRVL